MEVRWLHEAGLIGSYDDYVELPAAVLDDARLLMTAEGEKAEREAHRARMEAGRGRHR